MKTITLNNGLKTKVDDEDYEDLSFYNWTYSKSRGYAVRFYSYENGKSRNITMHQYLIGKHIGKQIDHINGDRLDNRKINLRIVTPQENQWNKKKTKNVSSRYKGVSWHKGSRKWRALIEKSGNSYNLGTYVEEIEAAKAYDIKAIELFGEYAKLNFSL